LGCLDIPTAIVRGTATTGGFSWPRLQDLWDPLAQPAFTSPFAHHCMRRLKSATPCRTAESDGFGAALTWLPCWRRVIPAGRPTWGRRSRPQNPAPKRQLWLLLETDKQHPSGRDSLYRAPIGTLASQYRARATPSSNPRRRGGLPQVTLLSPALDLGPSTRSAVCVLVVSRIWPTEGPALLLRYSTRRRSSSTQS
jgi:hypothetical protein